MWTQSKMSFALQQLKPLMLKKNNVAMEMAIQQLGLDFVVSDALRDYCRLNRDSVMVIFLATLALHNTANPNQAALALLCYQSMAKSEVEADLIKFPSSFVVRQIVECIVGNTSIDTIDRSESGREGSVGEWIFAMELLIDHGRTDDALILFEELINKTPEKESLLKWSHLICPRLNTPSFTVPHKIKWDALLNSIVLPPSDRSAGKSRTILVDAVFFQYYRTGIARVWRSLFREWVDDGFIQQLLVLDRQGTAPRIPGVAYRVIPAHNYQNLDQDRIMLQQICNEESANLFVSTYYTTPISTSTIFMAYDMIPEVLGFADINSNPIWRGKHAGIRHASSFVAISNNTANDLLRAFPDIPRELVSVAHCGVDFKPPGDARVNEFKHRYGIDRPYFLVVGFRGEYKNIKLFFQAFESLGEQRSNYSIVCTGSAQNLEPTYAAQVGPAGVHMLEVDDEELECAYAGAIALVYPSLYEGFGMPITEAMACGCPVITCPLGSIPEVAKDAVLYVDSFDAVAMTNALHKVQLPEIRTNLVQEGLKQAAQFSWKQMASAVKSVLLASELEPALIGQKNYKCRLCDGELRHQFNQRILDKYEVQYFACVKCHSLQTEEPHWLEEAYKNNISNLGTGAVQRNINNFAFCYTFCQIFDVKIAVDYGASDGLLCRFLRDHNVDCYAYDKYARSTYAQDFSASRSGGIDLLTAFEVLEHLPHPHTDLDEIFSFDPKYLLCTTEPYNGQSSDWWYLANDTGQHVFFYSIPGINLVAKKYGYAVTEVGGMFLFYKRDIPNVTNMIVAAQTALSGWIFQAIKSYVFLLPTSGVGNDYALIKSKRVPPQIK